MPDNREISQRMRPRTQRLARASAWVFVVAAACPARAGNPKPAPSLPRAAPHLGGVAMPHMGGGTMGGGVHMPGMGGGGVHMPGSMGGGGVHMPGSMGGGGVHMPGSMAGGGAHIPGSMAGSGAHIPGSMAGGRAHIPGATAGGAHLPGGASAAHVPGAAAHPVARPVTHLAAAPHPAAVPGGARPGATTRPGAVALSTPQHGGGHGGGLATAGDHPGEHLGEHGGEHPGEHGGVRLGERGGEHGGGHPGEFREAGARNGPAGLRADPRLGGTAPLHTHGLEAAMAAHHEPRPFLRADNHRDVARDHDFAAHHAADFHTRDVHGFSTRELAVWRGGVWRNEWHYGRRGWWWDVGGIWYGYDNPIWPYPLVVAPLTVYDADVVVGPDLSVAENVPPDAPPYGAPPPDAPPPDAASPDAPPAGAAPGIPPLPPAPTGYYTCGDPNGTFPGVGACDKPWDLVDSPPSPTAQ